MRVAQRQVSGVGMAKPCTLLDLPDDLLAHIAQVLSDQKDLISLLCLRTSCQRLRTLSCSAFQLPLDTRAQLFNDTVVLPVHRRQLAAERHLSLLQLWPQHQGLRRRLAKEAILALERETAHCITAMQSYEVWECRNLVQSWAHTVQACSDEQQELDDPAEVRQALQQHLWDAEDCAARTATSCRPCVEQREGKHVVVRMYHTLRDCHDCELCEFLGHSAALVQDLWDELSEICVSLDRDQRCSRPIAAQSIRRRRRAPFLPGLEAKPARNRQYR